MAVLGVCERDEPEFPEKAVRALAFQPSMQDL
jgi:hypothetical protein